MDILRGLLFIIALHHSTFYTHADQTSIKKNKSVNKPHGRHVANKRGWSTLFDPHGGNSSYPNISTTVHLRQNVSQTEATIASLHPVETIRGEKKRKRRRKKNMKKMLKKLRSGSLVGHKESPSTKRKCRNWSQCKKDECCIRYSVNRGFCKRRPQKGQRCKPVLLPGLRDCPCDEGLTCTRYRTTKWGQKKHRCERLRISEEEEKEQRYSTGLNKRTNKRNTK
ncbi:unnamed protein product [Pocillopora meandrina]|uniref:Dickkopf N-terminal cysteine-rich domain-containing protein n=1 Tax=Pocillopora meandrina TaxID=46732 RepID=A0AAU9XIU7_9CNID|nr:unnamed protein product [Pocillopora meandrina]